MLVLCPHRSRDNFKFFFIIIKKNLKLKPVEYILEPNEKRSFQYIPIFQSLIQILGKENLREKVLSEEQNKSSTKYESYRDGTIYKENSFYSEELRITLVLYVDDFKICNPLGTSRKKHKITAVYWVFGNLPHSSRSTLSSVYLALLCKAVDNKRFGYDEVLAPLLKDIAVLERDGIYISSVVQNVKGSVFSVAADNLGAHSICGLVFWTINLQILSWTTIRISNKGGEVWCISCSHPRSTCRSCIDCQRKPCFDALFWCKKGLSID